MTTIFSTSGEPFKLLKSRIREVAGDRYVLFSDLKKHMPALKQYVHGQFLRSPRCYPTNTWFQLTRYGWLCIGCKTFGRDTTKEIMRAAGIRMKRAKTGKKRKRVVLG